MAEKKYMSTAATTALWAKVKDIVPDEEQDTDVDEMLDNLGLDDSSINEATYPEIEQAVEQWLDEHPEATTSVQDGSITYQKLSSDVKASLSQGRLWNSQDIYLFRQVLSSLKYDSDTAGTIAEQLLTSLEGKSTTEGWTLEQIDLLDSLLSHVKYTDSDGGNYADNLIASLKGQRLSDNNANEV